MRRGTDDHSRKVSQDYPQVLAVSYGNKLSCASLDKMRSLPTPPGALCFVFLVVYKGEYYLAMCSSNAGLEKFMLSRPSNKCSSRIYPLVHGTFHDMFKDAE